MFKTSVFEKLTKLPNLTENYKMALPSDTQYRVVLSQLESSTWKIAWRHDTLNTELVAFEGNSPDDVIDQAIKWLNNQK